MIIPAADQAGHVCGTAVVINPNVLPELALFPRPNAPGSNPEVGTFNFVGNTVVTESLFTVRLDHRFSDRDYTDATYQFDKSASSGPDAFNFTLLDLLAKREIIGLE